MTYLAQLAKTFKTALLTLEEKIKERLFQRPLYLKSISRKGKETENCERLFLNCLVSGIPERKPKKLLAQYANWLGGNFAYFKVKESVVNNVAAKQYKSSTCL